MLTLKNRLLLAYASNFASYLIERMDLAKINKIILFGSAARQNASAESDIDLFIDIISDKKTEKEIMSLKNDFLRSSMVKDYWELKNVKNELNLKIGDLNKWAELKNSILSEGIILYGKYEELPKEAKNITLIYWENIKPESKRVLLSKRLFGYTQNKKKYPGLIEKFNGEKIKGAIIVPTQNSKIFFELFSQMKITVKFKKILSYN